MHTSILLYYFSFTIKPNFNYYKFSVKHPFIDFLNWKQILIEMKCNHQCRIVQSLVTL